MRGRGQAHGDHRPAESARGEADRASVALDDPFGDREPEAGACRIQALRTVASVKALERACCRLGADPDPGILHGQHSLARLVTQRDPHVTRRRRVAQRVVAKDQEQLLQPITLAADERGLETHDLEPRPSLAPQLPEDLHHDLIKLDGCADQRLRSRVRAREHEEIVDQPREPVRLLTRLGERCRRLVRGKLTAREELEVALQRGQRRAQLVRDVSNEALLTPVGIVKTREHAVERAPELAQLVKPFVAHLDPPGEASRECDRACGRRHIRDGPQGACRDGPAARHSERNAGDPHEAQGQAEAGKRCVKGRHRCRNDESCVRRSGRVRGVRADPAPGDIRIAQAVARGARVEVREQCIAGIADGDRCGAAHDEPHRRRCACGLRRSGERHGTHRHRHRSELRRGVLPGALQRRIHVRLVRSNVYREGNGERRPEHQRQERSVPERESQADAHGAVRTDISRKTYPAPRRVWMSLGSPPASSF